MWLSLELLMENSSARIVKQTNQNLCFGLVVKVSKSWLFIVLVLMPKSLLACRGGDPDRKYPIPNNVHFGKKIHEAVDSVYKPNLDGIRDVLARNLKTANDGWTPSENDTKSWQSWYKTWQDLNREENRMVSVAGRFSGRGKGSGYPDLIDWKELGAGDTGDAIPPWAYVPLNVGRPGLCYLPPIKGEHFCDARMENGEPGTRFGYNPYADECQPYEWNGCFGTRNKFLTKVNCEKFCKSDPPESCSSDSGIKRG